MLSNLWNKAKSFLSNTWNVIKNRGSTLLTGSHYIGPFNALSDEYIRTHPPKDLVDAGALHHDLDYSRIAKARDAGKISADETKRLIRESDERFLSNTAKNIDQNRWGGTLGYLGIKGKNILEDLGVLDPNKFVTARLGLSLSGGMPNYGFGDLKKLNEQVSYIKPL
jgi:hypothetical protein